MFWIKFNNVSVKILPSSGSLNLSSARKPLKYSYLWTEGESQDKVEVLLERENYRELNCGSLHSS